MWTNAASTGVVRRTIEDARDAQLSVRRGTHMALDLAPSLDDDAVGARKSLLDLPEDLLRRIVRHTPLHEGAPAFAVAAGREIGPLIRDEADRVSREKFGVTPREAEAWLRLPSSPPPPEALVSREAAGSYLTAWMLQASWAVKPCPKYGTCVTSTDVGALLAFGAKPDVRHSIADGFLPLHLTPLLAFVGLHHDRHRHAVEITKFLLAAGADPCATMVGGEHEDLVARTPLMWAVEVLVDTILCSRDHPMEEQSNVDPRETDGMREIEQRGQAACWHIVLELALGIARVASWNELNSVAFADLRQKVAEQSDSYDPPRSVADLIDLYCVRGNPETNYGFSEISLFYSVYISAVAKQQSPIPGGDDFALLTTKGLVVLTLKQSNDFERFKKVMCAKRTTFDRFKKILPG